jgi:sugar transferase EpsL
MGMKRLLDLAIAIVVLACLAPLMALIACAVRLAMGRPVLYRQARIGFRGRQFTVYKFRTMSTATDAQIRLLPDKLRLTKIGRLLRRTSLDELPQLWNVLTGEMSLVGPRPLLPEYLPRYTAFQRRRHETKPGITGWAQVNGRNRLDWNEKFELDVWYVDHWNLSLDIKILWYTLLTVLRCEGISQDGNATMSEFIGSHPSAANDDSRPYISYGS